MEVFDDRFQTESVRRTPDDGQRGCPKILKFYNRINLDNQCVWLLIKNKSITMHGNMSVKLSIIFVKQ